MAFATVPSTSESQREAMSDVVFEALVKGSEEKQKRQEAVSAILNENKVVGVVVEKEDGSICQVSEQENPGSYIPSFMKAEDSLEDFGFPECGEEELAQLESAVQVVSVDDGPSQARVAALPVVPASYVLAGAGLGSCGLGVYESFFGNREERFRSGGVESFIPPLVAFAAGIIGFFAEAKKALRVAAVGNATVVTIGSYLGCMYGSIVFRYYMTEN